MDRDNVQPIIGQFEKGIPSESLIFGYSLTWFNIEKHILEGNHRLGNLSRLNINLWLDMVLPRKMANFGMG